MGNVTLNNGETIFISSNRDITEVVAEHCSHELADIISSKIVDIDSEKLYAEERAQTDADSYLSELEQVQWILRDVLDIGMELNNYIRESKRINKGNIAEKVLEIIKITKSNI